MDRNMSTLVKGAPAAEPAYKTLNWVRNAGITVVGSAFIALCAHVSIPLWFTPVPITLQPFAVLLLGLLLEPGLAAAATLAYLVEGASGLPVFTPQGPGGLLQLLGPTGGYLLSYPVAASLVSALWKRGVCTFSRGMFIAALGSLLTLAAGAAWLGWMAHITPALVLSHAVLPFLPGDALKVCAAAGIAVGFSRLRRSAQA
jgi:biotin transport system substrate-specific component